MFFVKPKTLIVSIEKNQLKLLQVQKSKSGLIVLHQAVLKTKPLNFNNYKDVCFLANFIKKHILEKKLKTKKIALLLDDKYVFKYKFEFESNFSEASMLKLAIEKTGKILAMNEADFHFDYIKENQDTRFFLNTFSVKKNLVEKLKSAFAQAKLNIRVLDTENLCFERLLSASRFKDYPNVFWLDLNLNSNLLIFSRCNLLVRKSLNIDFSELETPLSQCSSATLNLQQRQLLSRKLELLVASLKATKDLYYNFASAKEFSQSVFLLSGFLTNFTQIKEILHKKFAEIEFVLFKMDNLPQFSNISFSAKTSCELNAMTLNVGLALRNDL